MSFKNTKAAVAFYDIKQAALYFDYVIPLGIRYEKEIDETLHARTM